MDERELLQTVLDDPDADGPRLVYADLLSERGDWRGELIQVQCALARLDPDDDAGWASLRRRELALLAGPARDWRKPWQASHFALQRGLPHEVTLRASHLPTFDKLCGAFPVRGLTVRLHQDADVARLRALRHLPRLRRLTLDGSTLAGRGAALARANLASLETLSVADCRVVVDDAGALLDAPWSARLSALGLRHNRVGAAALRRALTLPRLRRLEIASVLPEGATLALPLAERGPQLRELDLAGMVVSPSLVADPGWASITSLCVSDFAMLEAPHLTNLTHLAVALHLSADPHHVEPLAGVPPHAPALASHRDLETLLVSTPLLDEDSFCAFARVPQPRLRVLSAREGSLTEQAVSALAASACPALRVLDLASNRLGDDGVAALAASALPRQLRELDVSRNGVGDAGWRALAAADWPHLRKLTILDYVGLSAAAVDALVASDGLPNLVDVTVDRRETDRYALRRLAERFGPGLHTV